MKLKKFCSKTIILLGIAAVLGACATGPQVTKTLDVLESTDAPYQKVLVIALFDAFDTRRYLEDEVVKQLAEVGTDAVASTSMMNSTTPVIRQTFEDMVDKISADVVLVTQLASLKSKGTVKDMSPEATVNFRPTYYYNVWSVEQTEYVEPQAVDFEHSLVLTTQAYSVLKQESVWAIESRSKIDVDFDEVANYSVILNEAKAITSHLAMDGLLNE